MVHSLRGWMKEMDRLDHNDAKKHHRLFSASHKTKKSVKKKPNKRRKR